MTYSTTVAMMISGRVRYEMRLLFNRCHGENPLSCGASEWGEPCEFVESECVINEPCCAADYAWDKRQVSDTGGSNRRFNLALSVVTAAEYAACVPVSILGATSLRA